MIKKLKSITQSAVRPDRPERWKSMPKHGLKLKILVKFIGFIVILSHEIIATNHRSFVIGFCWYRH
jgi:preprotein translocase subunit Sss1